MPEPTTIPTRRLVSGTVEKVDFTRRQISIRVGTELRTLRSRKPLNLPGVRLGDLINVAIEEDGVVSVRKPRASRRSNFLPL